MKYELEERHIQNLMTFLDRVSVTGLKEVQGMQELVYIFNSPIEEKENNDDSERG